MYTSKLKPLYTPFFLTQYKTGYRIGIKFDKDPLAVEQSNYLSKILNVYIVFGLDALPRNLTRNVKFKNCLFGATTTTDKNLGKTAIWTIVFSSLLAPLNNVEEQRAKLASSNVIGSQHCVGGEGEF